MTLSYPHRTVFSLVALFVCQAVCLQFTFPVPGKSDYRFAGGDIALVEWTPDEVINQLALNCGPTPDVNGDTPAYRLKDWPLSSGVPYRIPRTWSDKHHKYCTFCTVTSEKSCSGVFYLARHSPGVRPMVHSLSGTFPRFPNKTTTSSTPCRTSHAVTPSVGVTGSVIVPTGYSSSVSASVTAPTGYINGTLGNTTASAFYHFLVARTPTPMPPITSGSSPSRGDLESSLAGIATVALLLLLSS